MRLATNHERLLHSLSCHLLNYAGADIGARRVYSDRRIQITSHVAKDDTKALTLNALQPSGRWASVFAVRWAAHIGDLQTMAYLPSGSGWEAYLRKLASGWVRKAS